MKMLGFFRIASKRRRRAVFSVIGGLVFGAAISLVMFFFNPFSTLRLAVIDRLYLGDAGNTQVVIGAIDEKTLSDIGKRVSEWPRSLHAKAIDSLSEAGARVIAFDVLFAEDSPDDAEVERAVRDAGNVVMPVAGVVVQGDTELAGTFLVPPIDKGEYTFTYFVYPKAAFADASTGLGHANMPPGPGDKIRHLPVSVADQAGNRFPGLSVAAVMTQFGRATTEPLVQAGSTMRVPPGPFGRDVPVNEVRQMRVNFIGGPGAIPRVSYIDLINGTFDRKEVEGKVVFIGLTATALGDSKATPMGDEMPGVEVHANAADTILRQRFLTDPSALITLLTMLAVTLIISLTAPFMRLVWAMVITLAVVVLYILGAAVLFQAGTILEVLAPVVLAILMFTAMMLYKNLAERAERTHMTSLFGTYVGKGPVAEAVLAKSDTGQLGLGGERASLSLLFTDIRGFSTFSEQMDPHDLVNFLNEYLTAMTDVVFDELGVLDKYIGDAVMAFWGWPMPLADHPARAMRSAIKMVDRLEEMQAGFAARGLPRLGFRGGVNSGNASVGNMGSQSRFSITAMGDTVNLAARLEPINNLYGTTLMVSGQTREMANSEEFVTRYIDLVAVKGRKTGSPIHELLGFNNGSVDTSHLPAWKEAMALYKELNFGEAIPAFKKVLEIKANDGPAKMYVDRCQYYAENPPEPDWDGVFVMKTK